MARVLVVDRPDPTRKALVAQLRRLGHRVDCADSALVAFELVRRRPPDLLAIDYGMLGMAGLVQVGEVLAPLGDRGPAVLFMAASPIGEVAAQVVPGVRVGFVQKPFELGELARAVRALLPSS